MAKKVLITGMSGLIGGALRRQMEGSYELSALNRSEVEGLPCLRASIQDLDAILPAFEGQDVVVHLAAKIDRTEGAWEQLLSHNVIGTYNVFEAARRAGVKRVVFASSGATIAGYEKLEPYKTLAEGRYGDLPDSWDNLTEHSPVRPVDLYGCSKVWGETLARYFSEAFGMSMICLRIGAVRPNDKPETDRQFSIWSSQGDIARLLQACVDAPDSVTYDVFYGVSHNKWGYRDMSHAREVLGFSPQDVAEDHR
ncbi:MAG: NAD(P)-dependent oxidoreductase [SAR324 cluster bacterium]|nr:NAD(P)-dependent oxidoreductase [SAR324 cluster bacterium]